MEVMKEIKRWAEQWLEMDSDEGVKVPSLVVRYIPSGWSDNVQWFNEEEEDNEGSYSE